MPDKGARIILQEMYHYAKEGNKEMVMAINDLYDTFIHKTYKDPVTGLQEEYDFAGHLASCLCIQDMQINENNMLRMQKKD